jgi:recombination associated protein RdgC
VRYARHTLDIDEIAQHIAAGKVPTQLAMTWNDRVSFVLGEAGQIRKLKMLDVVLKESEDAKGRKDDNFDANAAILTGELSQLIPELLEALGGEMVPGAQPEAEAVAA